MSPLKRSNNIAARMGRWSASHWKTAVFGWLAFVVAALFIGNFVGTKNIETADANVGQAHKADQILKHAFPQVDPQTELVLVQSSSKTVKDPAFRATIKDVESTIAGNAAIKNVRSPLDPAHADQVSKDGRSAMVLCACRQPELGEDARHMLLDGAERDHELFRNRLVRAAFRHQSQHLALAGRQLVDRIVTPAASDELRHDRRIERRSTLRDTPHRSRELVHVGDAIFQQVTDALRVLAEQFHRVGRLDVLREDEHTRLGPALANLLRGAQALVRLRRRHPDVDQGDVGLVHADVPQEILGCAALSNDLEAGVLEQAGDPLTEQDGVVREHYAHAAKSLSCGAEGWKARGQARDVELEELHGLVEPGQLVLAQIGELVRRLERVAGSLREQDLAAAARLGDARCAMDVQPEVRAVANRRLPGVEAHADTQLDALRPGMSREGALGFRDCLGCFAGVLEDDEELVAPMVDDVPIATLHGLAEKVPVIRQHHGVAVAELADELR